MVLHAVRAIWVITVSYFSFEELSSDVYKRQAVRCGSYDAPYAVPYGASCLFSSSCSSGAPSEPVSYTHLDVYKRQMRLFNKNIWLCKIEISRIQPDTCPVLEG